MMGPTSRSPAWLVTAGERLGQSTTTAAGGGGGAGGYRLSFCGVRNFENNFEAWS